MVTEKNVRTTIKKRPKIKRDQIGIKRRLIAATNTTPTITTTTTTTAKRQTNNKSFFYSTRNTQTLPKELYKIPITNTPTINHKHTNKQPGTHSQSSGNTPTVN